jgi:hypothetical protein
VSERRLERVSGRADLAPTQKIPLVSVVVEIPPKRRFARYQPVARWSGARIEANGIQGILVNM